MRLDRELIVRLSGLKSENRYQLKLDMISAVLGIKKVLGLRDLCSKFRCQSFQNEAEDALKTFRKRFISNLPRQKRAYADFSNAVYPAAALYLLARRRKVKIDRGAIIREASATEDKFAKVLF
eukprot:jgi/Bigna1/74560/fgenesh1_pg.29_\